jgi:16S rRNA (adenine1518-N6/adenine1519-N6)-dimethyltransferase
LTVMVQRDVAERITAGPGEMSRLALTVQYYCRPELLFTVPAKSFTPVPKVQSAVLHCDRIQPIHPDLDERLFRLIRAGFSSRRKQLHNSLMASLRLSNSDVKALLQEMGLQPTVRAQELSLKDWLILAKKIS